MAGNYSFVLRVRGEKPLNNNGVVKTLAFLGPLFCAQSLVDEAGVCICAKFG